jgi:hypothetical protein
MRAKTVRDAKQKQDMAKQSARAQADCFPARITHKHGGNKDSFYTTKQYRLRVWDGAHTPHITELLTYGEGCREQDRLHHIGIKSEMLGPSRLQEEGLL